jgi:hypothetical protein
MTLDFQEFIPHPPRAIKTPARSGLQQVDASSIPRFQDADHIEFPDHPADQCE